MYKKIGILALIGLLSLMTLTGCNDGSTVNKGQTTSTTTSSTTTSNTPVPVDEKSSSSHFGEYVNSNASIFLNEDGTFSLLMKGGQMGDVTITGKYTINGENIEFNSEKINGEELGSISNGKIVKNTITGPDGMLYTKSNAKG